MLNHIPTDQHHASSKATIKDQKVEGGPVHVALDGAGRDADHIHDGFDFSLLLGRALGHRLVQRQAFVHACGQVRLGHRRIGRQADVQRVLRLGGPGVVVAL